MNQAFLTAGAEKSITFEDSIENREVLLQQIVDAEKTQVFTQPMVYDIIVRSDKIMMAYSPWGLLDTCCFYIEGQGLMDVSVAGARSLIPEEPQARDNAIPNANRNDHPSPPARQLELSGDGLESAVNAFVMGTPATTSIANSSRHTSLADEHIHHHHNDYKAHGSYLYVDLDPESERHEMALQEMEYAVERRELALQGREEWISMDTNQAITLVSSLTTRLSSVAFRERTIQNREEALAARAEAVERREVEVGTQLAARERAISYHERGLGPMPEMPHEPVANYCAQFRVLPWSEFLSDRSPR